ncbi:MAG TPA: hypothetical protein VIY48_11525 [Candidatus Paceibacterota bacterium]
MADPNDPFATDPANVPVVDPTKNYLEELVGDGRKYATPEDLAKAAIHKDAFIEQLKRENAEAREAISKRINEEEFLKKLEQVARPNSPPPQDPPEDRRDEQAPPAITPEDIEKLLSQREAKKKQEENLQTVTNRLQELYGDDYRSRVQSQAKALGVGTDFLTNIAQQNPQAFYRLLGLEQAREETFSPPPRSSVSSPPSTTGKKDYAYFAKMRKEKGEGWYFSIPVQQEIWKAAREAEARGEKFLP